MKISPPGLVLLLASLLVGLTPRAHAGSPVASTAELAPASAAAIDAIAKDVVRSGLTPGLAVGVSIDGSLAFVRSYGMADLEHNVPINDHSIFRVGSITKQFTAAAILLLVEDGKLSLNDRLSKFLPNFPRASEVTLQELLNHTSGIRNYNDKDYLSTIGRQHLTIDQMVDYIAGLDKVYDFDPGTGWSYSNSGYYLLGAVIQKASCQPYAAFVKARIFDPQGLHDTVVDDTTEIVVNRAIGYSIVEDSPGKFTNAAYLDMNAAGAAGAVRSTVVDLLKWSNALFSGQLLTPHSLALMIEPGRLKNGQLSSTAMKQAPPRQSSFEYGLGLIISKDEHGRRILRHNGAINGFNVYTVYFPDRHISIVLLSNADGVAALEAGPKVAQAFFETGSR